MTGRDATRLGLIGMRERVMAMAGSLCDPARAATARGWRWSSRLPWADSPQSHDQDAPE